MIKQRFEENERVLREGKALREREMQETARLVREHLARLAEFKEFFPRYAECTVLGAVAGIVMDENVDRYAMNEGLFVIVQSGEPVNLPTHRNLPQKAGNPF
ncbi:MAG: hypothetical protein G8345_13035 [Magnetococcales bacterium]|nr:hypothetical protein [Magnetococcales bacterium]NGZ27797.1 hypothetical protein [Magnetococcales bacterium]